VESFKQYYQLNEVAIANINELTNNIRWFAKQSTESGEIVDWITFRVSKLLSIDKWFDLYSSGKWKHSARPKDPDWMQGRADLIRGEPSNKLSTDVRHVADWLDWEFNQSLATGDTAQYRKAFKSNWEMALKKADEWTEMLNKQASDEDNLDGLELLHRFDDGWSWVMLHYKENFEYEGKQMNHCVGSYFEDLEKPTDAPDDDSLVIFSLRDPRNKPHVTIEYGTIQSVVSMRTAAGIMQIQGNSNQPPKEEYKEYIEEFILKYQINVYEGGKGIDWGSAGMDDLGNIVDIPSDALYEDEHGARINIEDKYIPNLIKLDRRPPGVYWIIVESKPLDKRFSYGGPPERWTSNKYILADGL
tara:strand:- start:8322 stop:9398 length:1077 start_codon:yes stop_codon:yes gene_type:complete